MFKREGGRLVAMSLERKIKENGFAIVFSVISMEVINRLIQVLATLNLGIRRGGIRNLLRISPEVQEIAWSEPIRALIQSIVGRDAFPVRGILFDKTPKANWTVA